MSTDFVKLYNHVLSSPVTPQFALKVSGENAQGYCPFCEGNKFTVKVSTGEARCWSGACGVKTNITSFITKYHQAWLEHTPDEYYDELVEARGISRKILKRAKLAYDANNDKWLVPFQNPHTEFLYNLGNFRTVSSKTYKAYRVFVMPNVGDLFPKKIYSPFNFTIKPNTPDQCLIILEGEWDTLAMAQLADKYAEAYPGEKKRSPKIIGAPGASSLPEGLSNLIRNYKEIWIPYDNDAAGHEGSLNLATILTKEGLRVKTFNWSASGSFPEGYDIRDLMIKESKDFAFIRKHMELVEVEQTPDDVINSLNPGQIDTVEGIESVESLKDYFELYGKYMKLNDINRNAIIASFAVSVGTMLPGEALWAFLIGTASCLAGDTSVTINRAGKSFKISMKDLYHRFHGGVAGGKVWRDDIETKVQHRSEDGSIRLITVRDVMYSGRKVLYTLITESGKSIRTSADHKFYTDKGWKRLKNLHVGDYVYSNCGRGLEPRSENIRQVWVTGVINHPHKSWNSVKGRNTDAKVLQHRLVVEAVLNEMTYSQYVHILRYDAEQASTLKYLDPQELHVHHKDNNRRNNHITNLIVMTPLEHKQYHCNEDRCDSNVLEQTDLDRIVSITEGFVEDVYDLSVDHPHNFIADGIVVHNSGKTTWIESTGGSHEWCEYASKITAKNLVSGWAGKDPSLLPQMNGKAFMIKDFTTVLGMNPTDQKELFDILRDVYDGSVKITFGNGQVRMFNNLNFSMIAGVTPAIYKMNDSQLGARFLRIDYSGHVATEDDVLSTAIANFGKMNDKKIDLTKATVGYMKHIRNNMFKLDSLPSISQGGIELISNLARYVAVLRTKPEHSRSEGLIYRPRAEDPPRLALQFAKIAFAGHKVWHPTQKVGTTLNISDELETTLMKFAYDTCYGFGQDIIKSIYEETEMSEGQLQSRLGIPASRVHRVCQDLHIVKLVNRVKTVFKSRGRPTEMYRINPTLVPIMDRMYNAVKNQDSE